MLDTAEEIFIKQKKEWTEIVINFETKNQDSVLDPGGRECGALREVFADADTFRIAIS
jgi:hypothetical protein